MSSATLGINKFSVEKTGVKAEVPNTNLARLMYYLSCIFTVIQYKESNRLSDYQNYYYLTEDEKKTVLALATLFDPKIFFEAKIFVLDNGLLTGNFGNEFIKITDERVGVHVNQEIMIGGRSVRVLEIMAVKTSWLQNNYYDPLRGLFNELSYRQNAVSRNEYNPTTQRVFVSQPTTYYYATTNQRNEFNFCRCCLYTILCLYCFPFFLIYYCFCRDSDDC